MTRLLKISLTRLLAAGFVATVLLAPSVAQAAEARSDNTVTIEREEVVNDDVYAASETITVSGTINGGLVAAGDEVTIDGTVSGDVWVAANTLRITGTVGGSVRALTGRVTINGKVGGDLVAASGNVAVAQTGSVARDIWTASGNLTVDGTVGRNIRTSAAEVNINGAVTGNLNAEVDRLTLASGARVGGTVVYESSQQLKQEPGATVAGEVTYNQDKPKREGGVAGRLFGQLLFFLFSLILLIAILLYARRAAVITADYVLKKPWWSLLGGLLFLITVPLAALLLLVTVVGIPLSVATVFGYVFILYTAKIFVALAVGHLITQQRHDSFWFTFGAGALGLALFYILAVLPVVGFLLSFVVMLFGTGAQLLFFRQFYSDNQKKYGV